MAIDQELLLRLRKANFPVAAILIESQARQVEILAAALREIMKDAPAELPAQEDMPLVRDEAFIGQVVDTCAYFVADIAREALAKANLSSEVN